MAETWKTVPGFERTEVSDTGAVRVDGQEVALYTDARGYRMVAVYRAGKRITVRVHRLVALAYIPNPGSLPVVRHRNDVPDDNRVENLLWGTQADNGRDAVLNGRIPNALKTECSNGHPFSPANTRIDARGRRVCRRCKSENRERRRARKRALGMRQDDAFTPEALA